MNNTTAIITGDIINSRKETPKAWLPYLKEALNAYGEEPRQWEIYRGDSFQLEVLPKQALEAAIFIKATIKQNKGIDVRIAIGIGEKDYDSEKITESNGSAFVHSGACFEGLKKQTLALQSDSKTFDNTLNLMLQLASLNMNHWLPATARIVKASMENPNSNQKELAAILNNSQSNVSEALLRAGFDEVQKMMEYYTTQIEQL